MVLHLQNFDIIRIILPQREQRHHHAGKYGLNGVLLVAGSGERQGDAGIFFLDANLGLGAAHIIDGGLSHGNNSGNRGADNVAARLGITAVAGNGESGDSVVLGEKIAFCHSVKLQDNLGDFHLGVGLTMTDVLLLALLGLVLDDVDLLALAVLDDLGLDCGTFHHGSADLAVLAVQDGQNLIELDGGVFLRVQLLHEQDVAFGNGVLLATSNDNCLHFLVSPTSILVVSLLRRVFLTHQLKPLQCGWTILALKDGKVKHFFFKNLRFFRRFFKKPGQHRSGTAPCD